MKENEGESFEERLRAHDIAKNVAKRKSEAQAEAERLEKQKQDHEAYDARKRKREEDMRVIEEEALRILDLVGPQVMECLNVLGRHWYGSDYEIEYIPERDSYIHEVNRHWDDAHFSWVLYGTKDIETETTSSTALGEGYGMGGPSGSSNSGSGKTTYSSTDYYRGTSVGLRFKRSGLLGEGSTLSAHMGKIRVGDKASLEKVLLSAQKHKVKQVPYEPPKKKSWWKR